MLNNITGYTAAISDLGGGAVIQGDYVGTDWTGTVAVGSSPAFGILPGTTGLIGGTSPGQGNLIGGFSYGILVSRSSGVLIQGNEIGTTAAGTAAIPNNFGIAVAGDSGPGGLLIGGTASGAGNLISGNNSAGIYCGLQIGVTVQGNKIGTDVTGTAAVPNGIGIDYLSGDLIGGTAPGAGNLISGNTYGGVNAVDYAGPSTIQGNLIGTDITGTESLGNRFGVSGGSITLGGTSAAARNIISGNTLSDIYIYGGDSLVEGNFIGTDVTGETAFDVPSGEGAIFDSTGLTVIGNVIACQNDYAVYLVNDSVFQGNMIQTNKEGMRSISDSDTAMQPQVAGNTIGGTAPGQGNLICGYVYLVYSGTTGNVIEGNKIGTDITGANVIGPGAVVMMDGPSNNTIGGTTPGSGNLLLGVQDLDSDQNPNHDGVGNAILGNSFYVGNPAISSSKPIILGQNYGSFDLGAANDPGDTDTGPNGAQNYPVLAAAGSGATTTVTGTLNSTAGDTFRIEFYASPAGDPAGQGTGARYLGYTNVTTDSNGNASFNVSGLGASTVGEEITATATVLTGANANSTSEFSVWIASANLAVQPGFSSLASPTISYGTPSVTLSGMIAAGTQIPTGSVSIAVGGTTQTAVIGANGSFSTVVNTAAFGVASSPYTITYSFAAAGNFLSATDTTKKLTVNPAATTVSLAASASPSVPGQYVNFTANVGAAAGIPSPAGTVTFHDGSTTIGTTALQGGTATITVPLSTLGTHPITATFAPASVNYAAPAQLGSLTQTVQTVALEPGPAAGQSVLFVGGTLYNDAIDIVVQPKTSAIDQYTVVIDTLKGCTLNELVATGTAAGHIVKVVGIGNGTNDVIVVHSGPSVASWLFGGPGNNILSGGDGNNVLVGGGGANILFGGIGRSLLIAGSGPSGLFAGSGDTILIGGTTSFDTATPSNLNSLGQIMAEWGSTDSYATRVADLSNTGTGSSFAARLNGNIFLTDQGANATVFDNGESDLLVGGSGMDWFIADLTIAGNDRDTVINQRKNEILTPLG